jgi:hypothetical protein
MNRYPTRQQIAADNRRDMEHAKQLRNGQKVEVTKDDGSLFVTTTRSEPWELGGGQWVINLDGISGGFSVSRVHPI